MCNLTLTQHKKELNVLQQWLRSIPKLPQSIGECFKNQLNTFESSISFSDAILLLQFLKFNDFDVEKSKSLLVENLQMRKKYPSLFTQRDLSGEKFQQVLKVHQVIPFDKLSPDSFKITVFRTLEGGMKNHNACDVFRLFIATLDARLLAANENELPSGEVIIYDMKNFGFKHLMKFLMDVTNMRAYLKYSQEYSATKIVQVHFLNCSSVIPKLMSFVKPFLKTEVSESMKFHTNFESLHEIIPKECLPNEYGGYVGKLDDLNENWMKVMLSKR